MKKLTFLLSAIYFVFMIFPLSICAAYIVDTGQPEAIYGSVLGDDQWLAAEFTTDQLYRIEDAYFYINATFKGTVDVALYGDGGAIPDVSDELFRSAFTVQDIPNIAWYGLSGLNWEVESGTYWIALEVITLVNGFGFHGSLPSPSPNPLENEAFTAEGSYQTWDSIDMGIRIQGTPVPIPSSILLLTAGLVALLGIRRNSIYKIRTNLWV